MIFFNNNHFNCPDYRGKLASNDSERHSVRCAILSRRRVHREIVEASLAGVGYLILGWNATIFICRGGKSRVWSSIKIGLWASVEPPNGLKHLFRVPLSFVVHLAAKVWSDSREGRWSLHRVSMAPSGAPTNILKMEPQVSTRGAIF